MISAIFEHSKIQFTQGPAPPIRVVCYCRLYHHWTFFIFFFNLQLHSLKTSKTVSLNSPFQTLNISCTFKTRPSSPLTYQLWRPARDRLFSRWPDIIRAGFYRQINDVQTHRIRRAPCFWGLLPPPRHVTAPVHAKKKRDLNELPLVVRRGFFCLGLGFFCRKWFLMRIDFCWGLSGTFWNCENYWLLYSSLHFSKL